MGYSKAKLTGEERKMLGKELFPPIDGLKLPGSLRCERLREEVINDITASPGMLKKFQELMNEDQEMLMEFFMGNRGLNILYDPFFKKIMNQERLEQLLSQIMNQKVKIVKILPNEDVRQSAEGAVMILDMIVKLADGSYVDLEVQRISVEFPFERAVCYASDLVVKQYEQLKMEQKQVAREWREWKMQHLENKEPEPAIKFNYESIRPVYVIVLMNSGTEKYRAFASDYIHRTPEMLRFDTGLEERAIQRFIFISLDIFRRLKHNDIGDHEMTEMEAWMTFLGSDRPEDISRLVEEFPSFRGMYQEINQFRMHPEEMMGMIEEAIKILDEGDSMMQIERLHERVDQLHREMDQLEDKNSELKAENGQLQEEKGKLQEEKGKLQEEKGKLQEEKGKLQEEKGKLQEENEQLQDSIKEKDNQLMEQERRIKELEEKLRKS